MCGRGPVSALRGLLTAVEGCTFDSWRQDEGFIGEGDCETGALTDRFEPRGRPGWISRDIACSGKHRGEDRDNLVNSLGQSDEDQ